MARRGPDGVEQVLAVVRMAKGGRLSLKKLVREHLGLAAGGAVYVDEQKEIQLSASGQGDSLPTGKRGDLVLPPEVQARLGATVGDRLALIERDSAVAVKRVQVAEEAGDRAQLADREAADCLTRVAMTYQMPDELIPRLVGRLGKVALRHSPMAYWEGQETLEAWTCRRELDRPAAGDNALCERLIETRRASQGTDGSWDGKVSVTARRLRELADLGLDRSDGAVGRGVEWLLARPESPHNPGMYFATDELAALQVEIADGRKRGVRGRFREIKKSEQRLTMLGDDQIQMPCGPRLMWPSALALEALIAVGCEGEDRVQRALALMSSRDWCECGYQHGLADWRTSKPWSEAELEAFEMQCINQYRYGGLRHLDSLLEADDPKGPVGPPRLARSTAGDADDFPLRMDVHIQGCEFVTTRALSRVIDPRMQRFARAHLWRFAGKQLAEDGRFGPEKYGTGFGQAGILGTFARYDHPVVPVVVLRAVPWIVAQQHSDGSWGEGPAEAADSLSVLRALSRVGDVLPPGLRV